jgi:uncharacterized protein YrrD
VRLELGSPVHCSDGAFGKLADVVIDPKQRRVTHLVVEPDHHEGRARLVPAPLASRENGSATIALRATAEELRRMPQVEEFAYLPLDEFPLDDPDWDVGIEHVLAPTYDDYMGISPTAFDSYFAMTYDRIPKGEVEIRRSSSVYSADGHRLGHVEGFLANRDDRITHVVLERGHVFGRREVAVPIGAVANVSTDSVALELTKDEVAQLPSVPVHRWRAQLTTGPNPTR